MDKNINTEICGRCGVELKDDFCSKCGNPKTLKKIDGKYIFSEIVSILNFDKGFFFTIRELVLRPGENVKIFIKNDRKRLVRPITYVLFCSLFYTIAQKYLIKKDFFEEFGSGYSNALGLKVSALVNIFKWLKMNYGYTTILISIFIGLWIKLFFKKFSYSFFEIMTLLFYVTGTGTLIYTLFIIIEILTGYRILLFGGFIGFVYSSWAIGQFFNKKKGFNYLKGSVVYLLGMITFYFLAIISGSVIDLIKLNSN